MSEQGSAAETLGQPGKQINQREPTLFGGEKRSQDWQTRVPGHERLEDSAVAGDRGSGQKAAIRLPSAHTFFPFSQGGLHAGNDKG